MKSLIAISLVITVMCLAVFVGQISATTEPVCSYVNSQGERVFLKYFPLSKKGEDYVDFDSSGKCLKRAVCNEKYETKVENCAEYTVNCENKSHYNGVFPACCAKC
ncbi:uncharacterized protein ACN427_010113 [Glossina fuscipes fuscipes]|uniref:Single domain-containing protein n=1 Tax=Glossina palpalis gambiensis TaxID=67801 RepID=A0A1B0ALP9_9MUSC